MILGSAAGGACPQWNCNCANCRSARSGDGKVRPRTQASVAVSADGLWWVVLNASPDLRQQIEQTRYLHPNRPGRASPIAAVVLTGGEVDTVAGLLTLRERQPFVLMATPPVLSILAANAIFDVLGRDVVPRRPMTLEHAHAIDSPSGDPVGITVRPFRVPGKLPLYLETAADTPGALDADQTIGLEISDGNASLFFIPGCAAFSPGLAARLTGAEAVLFDGTLWRDDEMIALGIGGKTGRRMGHMSISGPGGTIATFAGLGVRKRVLIHMNNSNPVLVQGSPEEQEAMRAGWTVGFDGMEMQL